MKSPCNSPEATLKWKIEHNDDILPIISSNNPNNSNVFPKVRQIYENFQISKTLGKIFLKHKLVDCERETSNLKRLLCSSNISTKKPTFKKAKCWKSCLCYDYIIEGELCKFNNRQQLFILKSNLQICGLELVILLFMIFSVQPFPHHPSIYFIFLLAHIFLFIRILP